MVHLPLNSSLCSSSHQQLWYRYASVSLRLCMSVIITVCVAIFTIISLSPTTVLSVCVSLSLSLCLCRRPTDLEWLPGRRDISRIIDHISSRPQECETLVQDVFSWLGYMLGINWLSPVDLAVVLLVKPPKSHCIDWLIDWLIAGLVGLSLCLRSVKLFICLWVSVCLSVCHHTWLPIWWDSLQLSHVWFCSLSECLWSIYCVCLCVQVSRVIWQSECRPLCCLCW